MRVRVGFAVGCVAALAGTGWSVAAAAPPSQPAAPRVVTTARPAATTVRLITGDAVRVSNTGGTPRIALVPRSRHGLAGSLSVRHVGRDTYVVPTAAARYLGRVLDPSLFDVTAAARAGASGAAVTVAVTPGSSPNVPGLTVTGRSGSTWRGYLSAAGAERFGAALDKQWQADAAAHRVSRTLFGGVTRIAASGVTVSPPAAQPAFPQQTLTVKALDDTGKPAEYASLLLVNVDDVRKFAAFVDVVDGVAKVSVPTGRYAGLLEYDAAGTGGPNSLRSYFVPLEGISVTGSGATTTFDVRTATTVPNVHTPRPATARSLSLEWDRSTGDDSVGVGYSLDPDVPVQVAPTKKVVTGGLSWVTTWSLTGSPTTAAPYTYDLTYRDTGRVPADQDHTVRSGDVARVDARYYTDSPQQSTGVFGRGALYPDQFGVFYELFPFGTPVARTEYVSAPAGVIWFDSLIAAPTEDDPFQGSVDDGPRRYPGGSRRSADWLRGPLGPGFSQPSPADDGFFCGYCRDASSMVVGLAPVADTVPSHFGSFDAPDEDSVVANFRLYRNGKLVDGEANSTGAQVDVTAAPATYRAVAETSRGLVGFATSTQATTDVTFVSGAKGKAAPSSWFCPGDGPCTVLPVLTATVPLPTDLTGTLPQGSVPLTVSVGHAAGAADPSLTAVSVALTYDGGRTYQKVPVNRIDGHRFTVTLKNPASASGRPVGLRLYATDSAGGKLIETALAAYRIAR